MTSATMPSWVTQSLFAFGSPGRDWYGHLALRPDGSIAGYEHPNERTWMWDRGELLLLDSAGDVSSRYQPDGHSLLGRATPSGYPLMLQAIVDLPPSIETDLPPVLINSIPKSGTYFLEASLAAAGWRPTRLHLGPGTIDDYRGVDEEQMHREPHLHRTFIPESVAIAALRPGTVTVSHLPNPDVLRMAGDQGAVVLSLVRNLRSVVESFYRFRRDKVLPLRRIDHALPAIPPEEAVAVFMALEAEQGLALVGDVARGILSSAAPVLRYEECTKGAFGEPATAALESIRPGMSQEISRRLLQVVGKPTSSLAARRDSLPWTPGAEVLFGALGLADLNSALGY